MVPRTAVSAPICQVSPLRFGLIRATVPQEAWSPYSASTVGLFGVNVSARFPPPVCCAAQFTSWLLSPCAHSAEMSR